MEGCTIVARNYLAHARVLAESFLTHHPDGRFSVLVLDDLEHAIVDDREPFRVVRPQEIGLGTKEFHTIAMMYDVIELATAVKPWLLRTLLVEADAVAYFDPDIEIFAPLDKIESLAREHGIVLTPHTTVPMPRDGRVPSEGTILNAGIFNLGFVGVGRGGGAFLDWWAERLERDCFLDPNRGNAFVDQRWVDFVPALFPHFVLRDPGYNIAHWNVFSRPVAEVDGGYTAAGAPLRFYHFSGFDPQRPHVLSKHQGESPRVALEDHPTLAKLYEGYAARLLARGYRAYSREPYGYDFLPDGRRIERSMRSAYRDAVLAADAGRAPAPPDPFDPAELDAARALLPPPAAAPSRASGNGFLDSPGLNVVGYFAAELGIGEAGRQILRAVEKTEIPRAVIVHRLGTSSRQEHPFEHAGADEPVFDTNLIFVNADTLVPFATHIGRSFFENRYSIGMWWWEAPRFPPEYRDAFLLVDEIWVGSEYVAAAIGAETSLPVLTVPLPVELPDGEPLTRAELGLPDGFMFLFSFDFLSVFERKNPLAVIEAFKRAFEPGEGPFLVVKSINGRDRRQELDLLRTAADGRDDIRVMDEYVSAHAKNSLKATCDCYVSLHRSEGFGLTMAEAMAYGKPVIATGFSGNTTFMNETNSQLVPYELVPIPRGCAPYPAGELWADPDVGAAAELMRRVHDHPGEATAVGERARESILASHSSERTAEWIADRYATIRELRRSMPPKRFRDDDAIFPKRPTSPVEPARALLAQGPPGFRSGSSRRGPLAFVRRLLNRLLWPTLVDQHAFNASVVDALNAVEATQASLWAAHANVLERLERLEAAGAAPSPARRRSAAADVEQPERLGARGGG